MTRGRKSNNAEQRDQTSDRQGLQALLYGIPTLLVLGSAALGGVGIFAASALVAMAPALACVCIAWWLDRNEREPIRLLAITFLWGAVPAIGISLFVSAQFTFVTDGLGEVAGLVLLAPVIEEWAKSIGVRRVATAYRHEFDGLLDGLIYGSVVGFGFGATEDLLYMVGAFAEGGLQEWTATGIVRSFVFVTAHAAFTACFGAALGIARYSNSPRVQRWAPYWGLALAIALHSLHNALAHGSLPGAMITLNWSVNAIWLALVFWAVRTEARWIRGELLEEVRSGTLTAVQANAAGRYTRRLAARRASRRGSRAHSSLSLELLTVATELALARRRERVGSTNPANPNELEQLRARCRELSHELAPRRPTSDQLREQAS